MVHTSCCFERLVGTDFQLFYPSARRNAEFELQH